MTESLFQIVVSCAMGLFLFALGMIARELRDLRKFTQNHITDIIEDVGKIKGKMGIE